MTAISAKEQARIMGTFGGVTYDELGNVVQAAPAPPAAPAKEVMSEGAIYDELGNPIYDELGNYVYDEGKAKKKAPTGAGRGAGGIMDAVTRAELTSQYMAKQHGKGAKAQEQWNRELGGTSTERRRAGAKPSVDPKR